MSSKKLLSSAGEGGPFQSDNCPGGAPDAAPDTWPFTPGGDDLNDVRCALASVCGSRLLAGGGGGGGGGDGGGLGYSVEDHAAFTGGEPELTGGAGFITGGGGLKGGGGEGCS